MIKHIFFDLDHTLWDFEANSEKAFQFIFKKYDIAINFNEFITIYKPVNFNYWKLFRENKITKQDLKIARLKDVFEQLNYSISDRLIHKLAEEYLINLANYKQLFNGTIALLDYLKPKYKLHIITNGFKETQFAKMKNANLLAYFNVIVTSESVGVKKPNPKIFFYALKQANAKTYESVMIGDSLEADIYGAKNIGMKTIYFNPKEKFNTIDVVSELLQIKELL